MVQIADLCFEVQINNDIFVFLSGMFSEVIFFIITIILGVLIF